jgi:hypothetical protein
MGQGASVLREAEAPLVGIHKVGPLGFVFMSLALSLFFWHPLVIIVTKII